MVGGTVGTSHPLQSGPPNSDVLACKTVTCDRLLREQADGFSPARHGLNADSRWLGSAGHPQDISQCRRVVGALRKGAAASPRGVFEYTTAHEPKHHTHDKQGPVAIGPTIAHWKEE
ncbi:hypothetical protein HaLaN_14164 [Haematococcus lacustris]|uniref:Uncharacterized protein n=1 Tax=Haematococcus lacustris TaxID=44745 RepID=A0A699ZDV0_HAELA|nr:hypothetical protein HaLaN_14164 [Haematococcus lacustris]